MQWIDPALRQDIESTEGSKVLLVLRDKDNNRLIPARWGRLFNVEKVGKVVLFEYHLGDLIQYGDTDNVRLQEIIDRTKTFADNHNWLPGDRGQPLDRPSVFRSTVGTTLPIENADNLTAWGNAVGAIATAPCYARIEFLKVVGLRAADGKLAPVINESFVVKSKTVYELKVFQHVPEAGQGDIPSHSLELNTFEGTLLRYALNSRQSENMTC